MLMTRLVTRMETETITRLVPRVEVQTVERIVEVAQVQIQDKTIEFPAKVHRQVPRVEIFCEVDCMEMVQRSAHAPHVTSQYDDVPVQVPGEVSVEQPTQRNVVVVNAQYNTFLSSLFNKCNINRPVPGI